VFIIEYFKFISFGCWGGGRTWAVRWYEMLSCRSAGQSYLYFVVSSHPCRSYSSRASLGSRCSYAWKICAHRQRRASAQNPNTKLQMPTRTHPTIQRLHGHPSTTTITLTNLTLNLDSMGRAYSHTAPVSIAVPTIIASKSIRRV
jgi:hypothetical protein